VRRLLAAIVPAGARARRLRREFTRWSVHDESGLRLYRSLVPPGGLVFDVGANVGRRVRVFHRIPARVVAIEPQPRCVAVLNRLFGGHPQTTIEPVAVGAASGKADLHLADVDTISTMDPSFAEATRRSGRFAGHRWSSRAVVPVTTLDALIARHGEPDFVKIDVEGFEAEVLKGVSRPLRAVSVEFVPELWERSVACIRYLAALGPVETNLALGESMHFESERWMGVEDLAQRLEALAQRVDLFGDVYIRAAGASSL